MLNTKVNVAERFPLLCVRACVLFINYHAVIAIKSCVLRISSSCGAILLITDWMGKHASSCLDLNHKCGSTVCTVVLCGGGQNISS